MPRVVIKECTWVSNQISNPITPSPPAPFVAEGTTNVENHMSDGLGRGAGKAPPLDDAPPVTIKCAFHTSEGRGGCVEMKKNSPVAEYS